MSEPTASPSLRTTDEIRAAGAALARTRPPMPEEVVNRLALILAPLADSAAANTGERGLVAASKT